MSSPTINITLFPDEDIKRKAIGLSEKLRTPETLFTLQEDTVFPHVTLYRFQIKQEDIDKAKELLSAIARQFQPVILKASGYKTPDGYVEVFYDRTPDIEKLQMTVVDTINPLRDGLREKDKIRLLTATAKVKESLEKYGYWGVGELYNPHITFTQYGDGWTVDVSSLPPADTFSTEFGSIGISEQGKYGTMVRKLAEFKLGGVK
jgi:hypothetical protein